MQNKQKNRVFILEEWIVFQENLEYRVFNTDIYPN